MNLVGFPAPLQHRAPDPCRDFPDKPLLSIMTDMRQEATLTAAQNHCHIASVPVTKSLVQRSRTYDTFTEAYHSSERQEEVRRVQFDLISGGALSIKKEDLKKVQGL